MIQPRQDALDTRFILGLLTGTALAAGVMLWFAPQTRAQIRRRVTDSAEALGTQASAAYREVNTHVSDAVGELTRKGQSVRDEVADAVASGAHEVERLAVAARTAPRRIDERK